MSQLVLVLQGESQGVVWTNFGFAANSLEELFDKVSGYVAQGLVLKEVKTYQTGRWIQWPIDLFDGQSLLNQTRHLQHEWETILSPSLHARQIHQLRQATFDRQISYYEQQIHWARIQLAHLKQACDQAKAQPDAQLRAWNLNRLEVLRQRHELMMGQLQLAHQQATNFLEILMR